MHVKHRKCTRSNLLELRSKKSARKCSKVLELWSNEHFYMFRIVCVWFAWLDTLCPSLADGSEIVINCSGRGDKDVNTVAEKLGSQL